MNNSHIHPTIQTALLPFCLRVKTPTGERGFRFLAPDSLTAMKQGIPRLAIRDDEIPSTGLPLSVEVTQ